MIRRPAIGLLLAVALAGCYGDAAVTAPQPTPTPVPVATAGPTPRQVALTIYAAASLKDALVAVKAAYETAAPGTTLTISTDSSAALETKIEQGAPADVFLSADTTNPAKLVTAGLSAGRPVNFARNSLVLIVPKDNPAGIRTPFDLARAGVKIIAAGDQVPITTYATKLVENLAALPDAPAAFEAAYAANVVSKEENVKAVVAKIELGEGDVAIVYVTDTLTAGGIDAVAITPTTANVPATYAGVVLKASTAGPDAAAFLAWLAGPDGQGVLSTFGFQPAPA